MNNEKKELAVAALKNGIVIDHIPAECTFDVVNLLALPKMSNSITIGFNLDSNRCGKKGIIKISDVELPAETLNRIALVAPNAIVNTIKDYEVVDKCAVTVADDVYDLVKCNNPKCITNNEPMATHFRVIGRDPLVLKCHYCERAVGRENLTLK